MASPRIGDVQCNLELIDYDKSLVAFAIEG